MSIYKRFVWIMILIFIVFSIFFLTAKSLLANWSLDNNLLLLGNALLFAVSIGIFSFQNKALQNSNPNVFVRSIMGGMMLKMLVCAAAVIIYALASGKHFNKVIVLIFLLLYVIYLITEVTAVMKLNKQSHA